MTDSDAAFPQNLAVAVDRIDRLKIELDLLRSQLRESCDQLDGALRVVVAERDSLRRHIQEQDEKRRALALERAARVNAFLHGNPAGSLL